LKYFIFIILPVFLSTSLFAQKDSVTFIITGAGAGADAAYYLAGNQNSWNPADEKYRFKKNGDGILSLTCYFDKATRLQFKFTRGSWDKVECAADGTDINNHVIKTDTAASQVYYIAAWKDQFTPAEKKHTSSSHVTVLDTAFSMPQLNRKRRIWIYLPEGYAASAKHYPVLYMQDGQNVFDAATAYAGEWGVDECLDSLIIQGRPACIVVAIDNGQGFRMNEYSPYAFTWKDSLNEKTLSPQGNEYLEFITATLKPYIDKKFRTLRTKENTIIAGSSMGGLIAYYAVIKYSQVFGKAGVFSPSFWAAPQLYGFTDSVAHTINAKLFFYVGEKEGVQLLIQKVYTVKHTGENGSLNFTNGSWPTAITM